MSKLFRTAVSLCAASAVISTGLGVVPAGAEEATAAVTSSRLAGSDRFETAAVISEMARPDGAEWAFVVSGAGYADALAAGQVLNNGAALIVAPPSGRVPDATLDEVDRLGVDHAVAVGGAAAITDDVLDDIADETGATLDRIAGHTRYATAAAVAEWRFGAGADDVVLVRGDGFADALAASALVNDAALLLVPSTGLVPREVTDALELLDPDQITVVGGEAAVESSMVDDLAGNAGWKRISGIDRYDTAAAVAVHRWPDGVDKVVIARGDLFTDALAAAPLLDDAALLLVPPTGGVPGSVESALTDVLQPTHVTVLGGSAAIDDNTVDELVGVVGGDAVVEEPDDLDGLVCDDRPATVGGSGAIDGTDADDVIVGSEGADTIYGFAGDDIICGGGGDDVIVGGGGDDALAAGDGADTVDGGGDDDQIDGGLGVDSISAGGGDDIIVLGAVDTDAPNDSVDGGGGDDLCFKTVGPEQVAGCELVFGPPANLRAEIDASATIAASSDGDSSMVASVSELSVDVATTLGGGILINDPGSGAWLRITPQLTSGTTGTRFGGISVFEEAGQELSLAIQVLPDGMVRLYSIFNGPSAPTEVRFDLAYSPGTSLETWAGGILVRAPNGAPLYGVDAPWARDAAGTTLESSYSLVDDALILAVAHSGASYPVVADPLIGSMVKWVVQKVASKFTKRSLGEAAAKKGTKSILEQWWDCPILSPLDYIISLYTCAEPVGEGDWPSPDKPDDGGGGGGGGGGGDRSVTLAKGTSSKGMPGCSTDPCRYLEVTLHGFSSGSHYVVCDSSKGWIEDYNTSKATSSICYFGWPRATAWVVVDGVKSNVVTW